MAELRPIGRKASSAIILAALLCLLLVVTAVGVLWRRQQCRHETEEQLAAVAEFVRIAPRDDLIYFEKGAQGETGQEALFDVFLRMGVSGTRPPTSERLSRIVEAGVALDGWGRKIVIAVPGRLHPRGWDVYSVGANGIDENGYGDDICVGEDAEPLGRIKAP